MRISPKFIELLKRSTCTLVASILIAVPFISHSETKVETSTNQSNVVTIDSENPSFILISSWEKTENYSSDNLEYKRTISHFKANDNYSTEQYENDLEKIAKALRDEDNNEVFDLNESVEEVYSFNPEEEKELNTTKDIVEIEGTNIIIKIDSKKEELESSIKSRIRRMALILLFLGGMGSGICKSRK